MLSNEHKLTWVALLNSKLLIGATLIVEEHKLIGGEQILRNISDHAVTYRCRNGINFVGIELCFVLLYFAAYLWLVSRFESFWSYHSPSTMHSPVLFGFLIPTIHIILPSTRVGYLALILVSNTLISPCFCLTPSIIWINYLTSPIILIWNLGSPPITRLIFPTIISITRLGSPARRLNIIKLSILVIAKLITIIRVSP